MKMDMRYRQLIHVLSTVLLALLFACQAVEGQAPRSQEEQEYGYEAGQKESVQLSPEELTEFGIEQSLLQTVRDGNISMCGVLPAVIVMETLRRRGTLSRCHRTGYATSAETTGDTARVVGYAGMLLG